ncbi:tetratricopeptide repeat protein [Clostridium botulinum]|nr:tetratricopeptide repeat protein [Clostridium botulinum]
MNNDVDIYSFEGVIAMLEGDMELALMCLEEGIETSLGNFDLYCNLAYLYESQNRYEKACDYYKKALQFCNIETIDKINEKIEKLRTYYVYKKKKTLDHLK